MPMASVGSGLIITIKSVGVPGQVPMDGVTVIVPVSMVAIPGGEVNEIFPEPEAARPILVLVLVQLYTALAVPMKFTATWPPAQIETSAGSVIVGAAFTVTVKVLEGPAHPPAEGVTVMVLVWVVVGIAAVPLILPLPVAGKPVDVLLLVHA